MKTNKIKVVLSLNKTTVTKLQNEDHQAGVPGYLISLIFMGTGMACRQGKSQLSGDDLGNQGNAGGFSDDCKK